MTKGRWILVAAALAVVALLVYVVGDGPESSLHGDPADGGGDEASLLDADPGSGEEPVVGLETTAKAPSGEEGARALPGPVDLEKADRERDLHGIVVREDGSPVAGAALQALYYPWRYGRLLTDGQHSVHREGPSTVSARDGTFSLRLRRGDHVHLHIEAQGFATTELTMMQAGERVRVVLERPVRLIVTAETPAGEPAAGLELRVFRGGRAAISFELEGETGEDGSYTFADLPPGEPIYLDPRPRHAGWGDPGWIRIQLPDAGDLTHELALPEGRTLRGTVTDATTGKPLSNARVGMNWVLIPETRTDEEGRYELHGWTGNGVSDVHALAEGYGRGQAEVGSLEVLDFALTPGFRAHGRLVDQEGKPVEDAQVAAVGSERRTVQTISLGHALTGADGRFELTGLRRDMLHGLTVVARGFAQHLGDLPPALDGQDLDLGDLVLQAPRTLMGTLERADAEGIAREQVELHVQEAGRSGSRYGRSWQRRTDDMGRFRFEDLPPGTYTVSTRPEGGAALSQGVQVLDRDEPTVVRLVQKEQREVRVRVTDPDGKPVSDVWLHVRTKGGQPVQGQTDKEGLASLHLPPGEATLQVSHFAGRSAFVKPGLLTLKADQAEVVIALEAAAVTQGTLLGPDGKPLPWATIEVHVEGETTIWAHTGEEGTFAATTRQGVVLTLVFAGMVGASKSQRFRTERKPMEGRLEGVRAGATDVVVRSRALATDGSLRVRLLDPDGAPLQGIKVMLNPATPGEAVPVTDADGFAAFEALVVREVEVLVFFAATPDRPWIVPPRSKHLPEGQGIEVKMRRGARIEGTFFDVEGKPATKGYVTVMKGTDWVSNAQADEHGRFVAVVPADDAGPFLLQSIASRADGRRVEARLEGVRPGDSGVELRFESKK